MVESVPVVARSHRAQTREPRTRHGREIVMLDVQAVVDRKSVHRPVVGRGLLAALEDDVLLQDMRAGRMRTEREIGTEREVAERAGTETIDDRRRGGDHCHAVGDEPAIDRDARPHGHWIDQSIGKGLRQEPHELAELAVADERDRPAGGHVGIHPRLT